MRRSDYLDDVRYRRRISLWDVVVVTAICMVLAAVLSPVFPIESGQARNSVCVSNLKYFGTALTMYVDDCDGRMPDRRDLKTELGFRPWTSWPPTDPRVGWAWSILGVYEHRYGLNCILSREMFADVPQVKQAVKKSEFTYDLRRKLNGVSSIGKPVSTEESFTYFWMWGFDRIEYPVPSNNFWGKTIDQAVMDLQATRKISVNNSDGLSQVELISDPYFPSDIPTVLPELRGKTPHKNGISTLFLDLRAKFVPVPKTTN